MMRQKKTIALLALVVMVLLPLAVTAKLDITLYNEGILKFNKDAATDDWGMAKWTDNPKLYFELKLSGTILKDKIYFWTKAGGDNGGKDAINMQVWEAHVQFKFNKNLLGGSGELILFQNESRWNLGNPIYKDLITSPGDFNSGAGSIGLWLDTYDVLTLNELKGFAVVGDPKVLVTTNDSSFRHTAAALRARKDFFNNKLKIGAMQHVNYWFNKDNVATGTDDDLYSMTSLDMQMSLIPNLFLGAECAYTYLPWLDGDFSKFLAGKVVLSYGLDLRVAGKLYFYGYVAWAGEKFSVDKRGASAFPDIKAPEGGNYADIANFNRYIEFLELTYHFPVKAIYLKSNLAYCHRMSDWDSDAFHFWNMKKSIGGNHISTIDRASFIANFNELSIEFINGFYFKTYMMNYVGRNIYKGIAGHWRDWTFELSVENKLARIKPQVTIYNMGDDFEIYGAVAFGGDLLVNITKNFKIYTRFALMSSVSDYAGAYVNSVGEKAWGSFYIELQFFGLNNTEMYLRFGDGGKNEHLSRTFNMIAGGAVDNVLEFQIKFWL